MAMGKGRVEHQSGSTRIEPKCQPEPKPKVRGSFSNPQQVGFTLGVLNSKNGLDLSPDHQLTSEPKTNAKMEKVHSSGLSLGWAAEAGPALLPLDRKY